ncbi:MAG TPA: ATP synthase F1 subunit delta [Bacteroidota bacterium]|nr:ATP synthase F1 subunit delta [Candidatus Kapabacteria bacterium]HRS01978.1 ATP synthase F1 subunit delta [Bacteroidota bacterium]HRT68440.1 ATP synthase F1 subunit delta [Bacteroidota bacterium]
MTEKRIAKRYAKALFLLAQDEQKMEIIHNNIIYIKSILQSSRELSLLLKNPIINPNKKIKILEDVFGSNVEDIIIKFLIFVVKKNRANLLSNILVEFIDMYNEANNLIEVEIISAHPLNEQSKEKIIGSISNLINKNVIPKYKVNPKIIGGIQLKFADFLYDASVKKQLETLNNILSN